MMPWGSSIGPVMDALISVLASKKFFLLLCGFCPPAHLASGNMRNLPWLPTELGGLGWPLPPCPQRLCTVVPAPDHPLFSYVTPMAVSPGRNLHLSAMCIHREVVLCVPQRCLPCLSQAGGSWGCWLSQRKLQLDLALHHNRGQSLRGSFCTHRHCDFGSLAYNSGACYALPALTVP